MRLYNGCPDAELQAVLDARASAHAEAKALGIQITWFPVEERYMACVLDDYRELSGWCRHPREALEEAKLNLKEEV